MEFISCIQCIWFCCTYLACILALIGSGNNKLFRCLKWNPGTIYCINLAGLRSIFPLMFYPIEILKSLCKSIISHELSQPAKWIATFYLKQKRFCFNPVGARQDCVLNSFSEGKNYKPMKHGLVKWWVSKIVKCPSYAHIRITSEAESCKSSGTFHQLLHEYCVFGHTTLFTNLFSPTI